MSDIAIKVENLSKLYQLGEVGTGTLSKDLNRLWAKMRGKEDPYAKIGQTNDRTQKAESEFVWALKDINFEVKEGEVLGIIGRNGAGKSTLLKILSKITSPTTGKIYTKGRVASLLEVGTGFHPEMTGRENIYLNGAILGMRKWEIDKKFDEIVDFAGVEAYIDTPVKRYSSGMYVRLAFAVAAFLEPEILIVDEVLAVGDAEFQKKCLGRMKDVSINDGRTILFVSHNLKSMIDLCSTGVLLNNGCIQMHGLIQSCVEYYSKKEHRHEFIANRVNLASVIIPQITSVKLEIDRNSFETLRFKIDFDSPFLIKSPVFGVVISDFYGNAVCGINNRYAINQPSFEPSFSGSCIIEINNLTLHSGSYYASFYFGDSLSDFSNLKDILTFEIANTLIKSTQVPSASHIGSIFLKNVKWNFRKKH